MHRAKSPGKPHLHATRRWEGQPLASRLWVCATIIPGIDGPRFKTGTGPTPREAFKAWQRAKPL